MIRMVRFLIMATMILLVVLACQNTLSGNPGAIPRLHPDYGELTVSFGDSWVSTSTIQPPGLDLGIEDYLITLTGPEGIELTDTVTPPSHTARFYPLAPGEWTVVVEARNAAGDRIGIGQDSAVTIVGGQTTLVTIPVGPEPGQGNLNLSFSWPSGVADDLVAFLTFPDGTVEELHMTVDRTPDPNTAVYLGPLAAGAYELEIRLMDGATQVFGLFPSRVAVYIVAGEDSIGHYSPEGGAVTVSINADLTLYTIGFVWNPVTITTADEAEITLDLEPADPAPDQVRWYLNGVLEGDGPQTSLSLGPLDAGRYWLDVMVRKGTMLSSHGEAFDVVDP